MWTGHTETRWYTAHRRKYIEYVFKDYVLLFYVKIGWGEMGVLFERGFKNWQKLREEIIQVGLPNLRFGGRKNSICFETTFQALKTYFIRCSKHVSRPFYLLSGLAPWACTYPAAGPKIPQFPIYPDSDLRSDIMWWFFHFYVNPELIGHCHMYIYI